jgi:hypothetical protein
MRTSHFASVTVRANYPVFIDAHNVEPFPYKDFANELAEVMPRKRLEQWKGGKRLSTRRYYEVRDPATNMVTLAERREAS